MVSCWCSERIHILDLCLGAVRNNIGIIARWLNIMLVLTEPGLTANLVKDDDYSKLLFVSNDRDINRFG